jgi:lysophospholipase L1-like esterase
MKLGTLPLIIAILSSSVGHTFVPVNTPAASKEGGQSDAAYYMLILGDSVMWGQGLENKVKFTNIVESELFAIVGTVKVLDKSHSGATILPKDKAFLVESGEVPTLTPTLWQQLDSAVQTYQCLGAQHPNCKTVEPKDVNLVLLNGGMNDVGFQRIFNPFSSDRSLKRASHKYCDKRMKELLDKVLSTFENATVIVTGYYPVICSGLGGTDPNFIRHLIDSYFGNDPRGQKILGKKKLQSQNWVFTRMAKLSALWKKVSDEDFIKSIDKANRTAGKPRAHFARLETFPNSYCYAASETRLWLLNGFDSNKDPVTDDHLLRERIDVLCGPAKSDMDAATNMNAISRLILEGTCKPAGTGHPNVQGAALYAEEIMNVLKPLLRSRN